MANRDQIVIFAPFFVAQKKINKQVKTLESFVAVFVVCTRTKRNKMKVDIDK